MAKTPAAPPKNSVALKENSPLALPPEMLDMMANDAGMGVSKDPNEVGIPFLYILQDLSPQLKKRDEAYIEGAEVGDIYNNVTREVIPADTGIDFINVGFEAAQVEWKPNRGGFAGKHPNDTPLKNKVKYVETPEGKQIPTLPSGNILTETKYYYGFYRRHGSGEPWTEAVIGMSSSMVKCSREWQGLLKKAVHPSTGTVLPAFSKIYILKTKVVEKNNNSWFVWSIEMGPWVSGEEYVIAKAFAEQVLKGNVKTNQDVDADVEGGSRVLDEEVL